MNERRRLCLALLVPLVAVVFISPAQANQSDLYLKNTASYASGRYTWTVYVAGVESSIKNIKYVEYTLHYSFPKPVQQIYERGTKCPFALSSNSWGEFEIKAKIFLQNGEVRYVKYWLDLLKNKTTGAFCSPPRTPVRTVKRRR